MTPNQSKSKPMNVILWVVQVALAVMFIMAGSMKFVTPVEELLKMNMTWVEWSPILPPLVGISEVLGGLGLLLPALTRIKPNLTVLAAYGLAFTMVLAVIVHVVVDQVATIGFPILLGVASYFVAWGRSKKVQIIPR